MSAQLEEKRSVSALVASTARWIVRLHMAVLSIQFLMAFAFMSGDMEWYDVHATNAWVVLGVGAVQAVVALAAARDKARMRFLLLAGVIAVMEAAQIALGKSGLTAEHVTMAMFLWGMSLALLIQVSAPAWNAAAAKRTA